MDFETASRQAVRRWRPPPQVATTSRRRMQAPENDYVDHYTTAESRPKTVQLVTTDDFQRPSGNRGNRRNRDMLCSTDCTKDRRLSMWTALYTCDGRLSIDHADGHRNPMGAERRTFRMQQQQAFSRQSTDGRRLTLIAARSGLRPARGPARPCRTITAAVTTNYQLATTEYANTLAETHDTRRRLHD